MSTLETAAEPTNTSGYISSTGIIGAYADTDNDRYRGMASNYINDAATLEEEWDSFLTDAERQTHRASRDTWRAVVATEIAHTLRNCLPIEAAVELDAESVLLYVSRNDETRQASLPVEHIRDAVDTDGEAIRTHFRAPRSRIEALLARTNEDGSHRYRFVSYIPNASQLQALWGPTFGWSVEGIQDLQGQLAENAMRQPSDRDTWFTGIVLHDPTREPEQEDQLVAAMMAQRLDVPGNTDKHISVETTEWRVDDDYAEQGLGTTMVVMNTAQILEDMPANVTILGECNVASRADRAGQSAGYVVPSNNIAPHVLVQNVQIDGQLRDFTVLQLSTNAAETHYTQAERDAMLVHLNR